jgi:uncharacterized protein YgiM (DUF1202 family)
MNSESNLQADVKRDIASRRKWFALATGAILLGSAASKAQPTAVETQYVQRAKADIRDGKSAAAAVIATLKQGDAVQVVAKDESGWLTVSVPGQAGKTGFIFAKALGVKKPGDSTGLREAFAGRTDTTEVTAAAAAKGLEPGTIAIAKDRKWDTATLDRLIKNRNAVTSKELEAFKKAMKV